MSVYAQGTFTRSGGIASAISKEMRQIKLSAVKKIEVNFDPFLANANPTREFLFRISHPLIRQTNLKCVLKTSVLNTREDPFIKLSLIKGDNIKFKAGNLSLLEILKLYNKYITPHNPIEEKPIVITTKAGKKGLIKRKK